MRLETADSKHLDDLLRSSKAAFDSDVFVGAEEPGGPPGYDSLDWHVNMMNQGHLLAALEGNTVVGGAIFFFDQKDASVMYVGRIFVHPDYFHRGYGREIMRQLENLYPSISTWILDTPIWNQRTNKFYREIGYVETHRDEEFIYYKKES